MKPKAIITFAILVLVGVLVFVLVLPQLEGIMSLTSKLSKNQKEAQDVKSKFETTRRAISQFQSLKDADIAVVESAFPSKVDLPDLLVLTDSLISRAGLLGENIAISVSEDGPAKPNPQISVAAGAIAPRFISPAEVSGRGEVNINFSVVGNYESFKVFLGTLEKSLRIFDVQSISFATPPESEKIAGAFRFGVSMKTYFDK